MKNVEDVYPLTPMQEVMLFHAITRAEEDVLFNQVCYKLHGAVDAGMLKQAWQAVLNAHPALRTAFVWKGLKQAQQIVRREVDIPFRQLDWRERPVAEQERMFEALRHDDRNLVFDLQRAPLLRLTLVLLTDTTAYLVWSSHHLILDRWCIALVVADVLACFQAAADGRPITLKSQHPYKNYIAWLSRQDATAARQFWSREFAAYNVATAVTATLPARTNAGTSPVIGRAVISQPQLENLKTFCRRHRVTLATLVQGAWALVLNQLCASQDITFGVVVSGRPAALPDVEAIVGSFVNNLPIRVRMAHDQPVAKYLQALQLKLQQVSAYDYVSVNQIQEWANLAPGQTLFDTMMVWLAPVDAASPGTASLQLTPLAADVATAYPLTLGVEENAQYLALSISVNERRQLAGNTSVAELVRALADRIQEMAGCGGERVLGALGGFHGELGEADLIATHPAFAGTPVPEQQFAARGNDTHTLTGREQLEQDVFEEYLLTEWRQVLQLDEIPPDADFFALGGDSLKAALLLSRIERGTRKRIPMLALFQQATIRDMARVVLKEEWPLVPAIASAIRTRGQLAPLFCVASPEVNIIGFSILSRYLDADRPVYVLQAPPQSESLRRLLPQHIPELAARYIESLRPLQGSGPYQLLGMCSGAQLGIEMVRQLQAQGHSVSFFGVIDTWAFFTLSKLYYLKRIVDLWRYYQGRVSELAALESAKRNTVLRGIIANKLPGFSGSHLRPNAAYAEDSTLETAPATPVDEVGWANADAEIVQFAGTLTLFRLHRHKQQFWRVADSAMGWGKHAGQVQVVSIPGRDRQSVLREPGVRTLAMELENCLKQTEKA